MSTPATIAVANTKGGTSKTTTAAFLLHAAAERGMDVLGVDADPENESLLRWSELGEWTVPVVGLPVTTLHSKLAGIRGTRDLVVIDTPPMERRPGVVTSALRAATHLVIPMAPTAMDYDRLAAMLDLTNDVEPLRDQPLQISIILTQVVRSAAAGDVYAELAAETGTEYGAHVLRSRIPMLQRFAQSFGIPIDRASGTAYGDALQEVLAPSERPTA